MGTGLNIRFSPPSLSVLTENFIVLLNNARDMLSWDVSIGEGRFPSKSAITLLFHCTSILMMLSYLPEATTLLSSSQVTPGLNLDRYIA
jgi:hypothetical protein